MTRSAVACPLGPEFDPFLFAPIGVDRNGMALSVLSALARMDVDPWLEAARLTALPEPAAIRILAALLPLGPDGASADTGGGVTAARLIALLPRRAGSSVAAQGGLARAGAAIEPHVTLLAIPLLILMACMLGFETLAASDRPPAPIIVAPAPASSTAVANRPSLRGGP